MISPPAVGRERHRKPLRPLLPILALAWLQWATPSWGKSADLAPVSAQVWDEDDGLPGGWVRDFAQTKDGRLWVATDSGVGQLVGERFDTVAAQSGFERIASVVALAVDGRGRLWMGPLAGEPVCLNANELSDCLPEGHRIARPIRFVDMESGPEGSVWFAAEDLVYVFSQGSLSWVSSVPATIGIVRAINVDHQGNLWIGGTGGLFVRSRQGEIVRHAIAARVGPPEIRALARGRGNTILVAGASFLLRVGPLGDEVLGEGEAFRGVDVRSVIEDKAGRVWLSGSAGLFRVKAYGELGKVALDGEAQMRNRNTTELFEDDNGYIWIGTESAGVIRILPPVNPPQKTGPWLSVLSVLIGFFLLATLALVFRRFRAQRGRGAAPGDVEAPR